MRKVKFKTNHGIILKTDIFCESLCFFNNDMAEFTNFPDESLRIGEYFQMKHLDILKYDIWLYLMMEERSGLINNMHFLYDKFLKNEKYNEM